MRRAGTGAVIAALPMKSVWANGITNSIIASGHGSDWAGGATLNLLNWGGFQSMYTDPDTAPLFSTVFNGNARHKDDTKFLGNGVSFYNILHEKKDDGTSKDRYQGPKRYNQRLIAMYLNALHHNTVVNGKLITYPVVNTNGRPFSTLADYADYLYSSTINNPAAAGREIKTIIRDY
jgi:hypothetical protein